MTLSLHTRAQASPPPAAAGAREFRDIYRVEIPFVCKLLLRLGVEPRHLNDLAQDVFVAAFQRFDSYDRSRPIRPWLLGIAYHRVSAFRQRAGQQREVEGELPELPDERPTPDEELAARQGRELVLRALSALDLEKRAVLVMHDIDGWAIPEVARALSIPLNTAYSRLRRARELFEAEVRRSRDGGGA
ncbi:MAG: RNA polymerase sigma factor [Myxococcaceae bacterium]